MMVSHFEFEAPLSILNFLNSCKLPDNSYIDVPTVGLSDINFLPASLLHIGANMTDDKNFQPEKKELESLTIKNLVIANRAKIIDVGSGFIRIEYNGGWTFLFEIMRASFHSDGIQEILIQNSGGPIDGTYVGTQIMILKRKSESALFSY